MAPRGCFESTFEFHLDGITHVRQEAWVTRWGSCDRRTDPDCTERIPKVKHLDPYGTFHKSEA